MFQVPEPPPLDYYINDVTPNFLSDGILLNCKPGPTHKCIAKQLVPILKKSNKWAKENEAWFVDSCGRNARALHAILSLLPKEDPNLHPYRKKRISCIVGSMNDYSIVHLNPPEIRDTSIRKKLQLEDSKAYLPGSLYRQDHPEDNHMQEVLDRADAFKVEIHDEGFRKEFKVCDCSTYATIGPNKKIICSGDSSVKSEEEDLFECRKWQPDFMVTDKPKDEKERRVKLAKVSRPYLHELNIWYAKNMPTQSAHNS